MKRPNRDIFEKHIASLNVKIEALKDRYLNLAGQKCHSSGATISDICQSTSLSVLQKQRSLTASSKLQREQTRAQLRQTLEKLHESQQKIKTCKNEMAKVESQSLYYKDERKLAAYLARLEKQYADMQTTNAREEKALITQIDKAKRNQKQLVKWRKLEGEKEDMIKTLNELKGLRDTLYKTVGELKTKEIESRNNERSSKIQIKELTNELNNLYQEKRRAISEYENERQLYADTRRRNKDTQKESASLGLKEKLPVQRTSSGRPIVHYNDPDSDLENDDYELFYTEKQLCKNLMAYVQQFLAESRCSIPENDTVVVHQETGTTSKDHSDEEIKESQSVPYVAKGLKKKHSSKRDKQRRLTQSIPHAPHVFNDFERVGLKAPVNYSELPVVLEKLKTTLKYYEDQTLLPLNFSIPLNDWSYATSESELTVDTDSYLFSVLSLSGVDESSSSQPNTTIDRNFSQCSLPLGDNFEIVNEESQNSLFDDFTLKNTTTRKKHAGESAKLKKTLSLINFGPKKRSNNSSDRRWSSLESLLRHYSKHKNSTNDEGFHSKGSTR